MLAVPTSPGDDDIPALDHQVAPNAFDLMAGHKLQKFSDPLIVKFASRGAFNRAFAHDYVTSGGPFPIVSAALRQLLIELCSDDLQFFDVEFRGPRGAQSTGRHFATNVAVTFSAIDLDKSDKQGTWNSASPPEFVIWGFRKIVLKEQLATVPYIFREASCRSLDVCNDKLQQLCRERNLNVDFRPLAEWGV
jgi:hypothetical protein